MVRRQESLRTTFLNVNGEAKQVTVDKKAHERQRLSSEYEAPSSDAEKAIAKIWEKLFGSKTWASMTTSLNWVDTLCWARCYLLGCARYFRQI